MPCDEIIVREGAFAFGVVIIVVEVEGLPKEILDQWSECNFLR